MKRLIAAVSLTVAGLGLVLGFKTRDPSAAAAAEGDLAAGATTTTGAGTTVAAPAATTTTSGSSTTGATTTTAAPGTGTVEADGAAVQTRYGTVQVSVMIADGVLVDVVSLQMPDGDQHSAEISNRVEPMLEEMALEAQSAAIDVVSGATFTSTAYAESLQAALDAAGM